MYNRPSKPKTESFQQKENRSKFSRAVEYSRRLMADPLKKAEYKEIARQQNLPNAYTAAVTEFMRKPEIEIVDEGKTGNQREEIRFTVRKKGFDVQWVEVKIVDESGKAIEEGRPKRESGYSWLFSSTINLRNEHKSQVIIRVKDNTGQIVENIFPGDQE